MKRRTYLAGTGGLLGLLAGCGSPDDSSDVTPPQTTAPTETPPSTEKESTAQPTTRPEPDAVDFDAFDSVVDAVEDANCDPTGREPCQAAVRSALDDGVLLRFPAGTYRFTAPITAYDVSRVGIIGEGDVTFVVPEGFTDWLFHAEPADEVLFRNVDIDQTAVDASTGLRIYSQNGFHVEDVEFVGRGVTSNPWSRTCLVGIVRNPNATGLARRVVAKQGSGWNRYKSAGGKIGMFVGTRNRGRIRIEDCRFEELGNNGIYASRHRGTTEVVGGLFRNNNVASIRIGGAGSFVDGATIEMDGAKYTGPRSDTSFQMRGIVIEQGAEDTGGFKPAGAAVRNCDITVNPNPTEGDAIQIWSGGRSLTLEDTLIRVNNDGSAAVNRRPSSQQGRHPPGPEPRWVRMKNVSISGTAAGDAAVTLQDASGSRIESCDISQTGDAREGISLIRSTDLHIDGGSVRTTRFPIRVVIDRPRSDSACLLSIGNPPNLESSGLSVGPTDEVVGGHGAWWLTPSTWSLSGCLPGCVRLVNDTGEGAGPVVVGIADIRCRTVYGEVSPPVDG